KLSAVLLSSVIDMVTTEAGTCQKARSEAAAVTPPVSTQRSGTTESFRPCHQGSGSFQLAPPKLGSWKLPLLYKPGRHGRGYTCSVGRSALDVGRSRTAPPPHPPAALPQLLLIPITRC